ncbi:MAG: MFS transporter [Actinomycetota bacterium]
MSRRARQTTASAPPGRATASSAPPGGFGPVLRSKPFRRLLVAQSISSLGDWVATFAFMAAVYQVTKGNQTAVAGVLVARLVPPMFAAPVGGVVADRLPRRLVMVSADISRAALIALAPFVGLTLLYVVAFVHECISLFFLPARDATVPELVPRDSLPEANGLILASSYGTLPVAAAISGGLFLVARHIPQAIPFADLFRDHPYSFAFFFDSASFVLSASLLAGLSLKHRPTPGELELFEGVVEGVKYVIGHQVLRSLAYGLVVSMFGGGVLFAVGIAYIKQTLGGTDVQFAWLASLWGLGMGLGLLVVRFLIRGGKDRVFLAAVATCGGILIVMAALPYLFLAFGVAVLFGAAFSVAIVLALTAAQEIAEDRIRGRIMGGVQMLFRVGLGAGALGIGGLAHGLDRVRIGFVDLDGNQVGMIAGGVLILLGAAAASGVRRSDAWAKV